MGHCATNTWPLTGPNPPAPISFAQPPQCHFCLSNSPGSQIPSPHFGPIVIFSTGLHTDGSSRHLSSQLFLATPTCPPSPHPALPRSQQSPPSLELSRAHCFSSIPQQFPQGSPTSGTLLYVTVIVLNTYLMSPASVLSMTDRNLAPSHPMGILPYRASPAEAAEQLQGHRISPGLRNSGDSHEQ